VLYWLYERALLRRIALLPGHICFMLTEHDVRSAPQKIYEVTRWSRDISHIVQTRQGNSGENGSSGIMSLTFHISTRGSCIQHSGYQEGGEDCPP
jgi:hypothetical protein